MTIEGPPPDPPEADAVARPGLLPRVRGLALDIQPLRDSPQFRLLWIGRGVTFLGSQFTRVAVPYQVYRMTGSSLAVGLVALAELGPLLVASFLGGALADAGDRRRLLIRTDLAQLVVAGLLGANALLPTPRLWAVFALAAAGAGLNALGVPARTALVPRLVAADQLVAAASLQALYGSLGFIVGPSLAGLTIAGAGLPAAYLVDAATFAVAIGCALAMTPQPPSHDSERLSFHQLTEGWRFLRGRAVIQGTYLVDFVAMVFGMPMALFPALAAQRFGGSPRVLGLLYSALAVGALCATLVSGGIGRVHRQGLGIVAAAMAWGLAVVAFGMVDGLVPVLVFLAAAGAADMVSGTFRMAIWNTTIPDGVRGRLAGLEWANVNSGPVLGDVEAGLVARLTSLRFAIVSGGVACVVGAILVGLALPSFLSYDTREQSS